LASQKKKTQELIITKTDHEDDKTNSHSKTHTTSLRLQTYGAC